MLGIIACGLTKKIKKTVMPKEIIIYMIWNLNYRQEPLITYEKSNVYVV